MSSELSMRRKERKYIILEHTFDEIIDEIKDHIPIYHFDNKQGLINIETIYMDTSNFLLYHEFLNRRKFRFKIRLRRYGCEGVFEPVYLVEMKVSHDALSTKKRFMLPAEYYQSFINNEDLKQVVKEANEGFKGAQKTYKLIRELLTINNFVPVLQTSYNRVAFQKKSKRIRLTVDSGIVHKKLLGKPRTESMGAVVLESKIMGKSPKWHKKMVNRLSLLRQQRFSKFATGINSIYFPERGKYNFYCDDEHQNTEIPQRIKDSFEVLKPLLKLDDKALYEV